MTQSCFHGLLMLLLGILVHYVTIEHPASESSCGFRVLLKLVKSERAFCRVLETARDFRLHCLVFCLAVLLPLVLGSKNCT